MRTNCFYRITNFREHHCQVTSGNHKFCFSLGKNECTDKKGIMYPEAKIPVAQVSLPTQSFKELVSLGTALRSLRNQGVLVIGSGGSVHNLSALRHTHQTDDWAIQFEQWLLEAVEGNHSEQLTTPSQLPANFRQAHPTLEHFAPLIVAWAAGNQNRPGRRIHHSFTYGNLGMSCFEFGTRIENGDSGIQHEWIE